MLREEAPTIVVAVDLRKQMHRRWCHAVRQNRCCIAWQSLLLLDVCAADEVPVHAEGWSQVRAMKASGNFEPE
jgi:hypothetical protein